MSFHNSAIFPITSQVNSKNHLVIGGCDVIDLVTEFGTPLYIIDEHTMRSMCKEFVHEFTTRYPKSTILYAAKAYINPSVAELIKEEGLGIDIVSGGELAVAKAVNFPQNNIYFHGNNKSLEELRMAIEYGVKIIVVDNFHELTLLEKLVEVYNTTQEIMIRLSPGVDPHTHSHTTTGILDSKFGFSIETGDARNAILKSLASPHLNLIGFHFHLGSPIFELEPYEIAINTVLKFVAGFKSHGLELKELSPGGGFAIGYLHNRLPPPISSYATTITSSVKAGCKTLGLEEPTITVEPGRSIIGRAGVAVYTVGSIKTIPKVRKYVSLDGGMGDNIRPALYNAPYEAVVSNRMSDPPKEIVTLAGKFCESGDILVRDIALPTLEPGDIISIPAVGAYAPSMANNYNLNPRPAVVMVKDKNPQLIRRRETYQDMMLCDIL